LLYIDCVINTYLADRSVVVLVLTRRTPSAICKRSDCSNSLNVLATFWATHCGHSAAPQPRNHSDRGGGGIRPIFRPVAVTASAVTASAATAATDATSSIVVACSRLIFRLWWPSLHPSYLNNDRWWLVSQCE